MLWTAGTCGERSVKLQALGPTIIPSDQQAPQVFLDYAHAMTLLPELIQDLRASQDSSQVGELEELTRTIPKLIGLLPAMVRDQADVRQNVAVTTMISGLTRNLDNALPLTLVSWEHLFSPNAIHVDACPRIPDSFAACRWTRQPSYTMQGPSCILNF